MHKDDCAGDHTEHPRVLWADRRALQVAVPRTRLPAIRATPLCEMTSHANAAVCAPPAGVLGLPDTGGQVVYILDQVQTSTLLDSLA